MSDTGTWVQLPASVAGELPGAISLAVYQQQVTGGHLTALVAFETVPGETEPVWHLSISHRTNEHPPKPGRRPHRTEISEAKRQFLPDITTYTQAGDQPHIVHVWQAGIMSSRHAKSRRDPWRTCGPWVAVAVAMAVIISWVL